MVLSSLFRQNYSRALAHFDVISCSLSQGGRNAAICSNFILQSQFLQQSREMSRVKTRHTHPKSTWPVKRRERNDQELIPDNEDFVKQVILDRLGPGPVPDGTGMPFVSPLKQVVQQRGEWAPGTVRIGVIAKKLGTQPMWDKTGKRWASTLLQVTDNHVIRYIPPDVTQQNYGNEFKEGMGLMIVGADGTDPTMFTKEYCGLFNESGTLPKKKLRRFPITPNSYLPPGTPLYATHYLPGQKVDIYGYTIRRGFHGVMKRWGFRGMPATHGVTKSHRRGGNIGGGGEKGRVWPGTKMPGHMGGALRYQRAITILRINTKYNVLYVKGGSVPGEIGSFVTIRDCFLHQRGERIDPPFPTHYPEEAEEPLSEDMWDPSMHVYNDPSITFEEKL